MVWVQGTVITGSTGIFIANTAVVSFVAVVVVFSVWIPGVGLLLGTDDAAVVIVTGDVGFAGVFSDQLILCTV